MQYCANLLRSHGKRGVIQYHVAWIICRSSADFHLHLLPPAAAVHTADRLDTVAAAAVLDDKVVTSIHPVHLVGVLKEHNPTAAAVVPGRALEAEAGSAVEDMLAVREGNYDDLAGSLVMYHYANRPRGCNSRSTYALDLGHAALVARAGRSGIAIVVGNGSFVCSGRPVYHRLMCPSLVGQSLIAVTASSEAH